MNKILIRLVVCVALQLPLTAPLVRGQAAPQPPANQGTVLFIGNSFTFAALSAVHYYRSQTVTDLNGDGVGGVPALFKLFANEAGLDFTVSLETVSGQGLDYHIQRKADVIARSWDFVVMHGYSTLDQAKPGDPGVLIASARQVAELLHSKNPKVDIRLMATWSRADQVYPDNAHWHGKPIETMAEEIRSAYDQAAAGTPFIHDVIPVGEAWNRAIRTGLADPNPYDGIAAGQFNLWAYDNYHASIHGYYLEALMDFGDVTGLDPRSLGRSERAASDLGISPAQATALQKVAYDELTATKGRAPLKDFRPVSIPR